MHRKFTRFVLHIISPYRFKIALLVFLLIYIGVFWSFSSYALKLIIDALTEYHGDPQYIWPVISPMIIFYLVFWASASCSFRLIDIVERSLYPHIRQDIMNQMFAYIIEHSHGYFQSNLSGSISNRITDMQTGVVSILRKMDEIIFNLVFVFSSFVLLISVQPYIALILSTWLIFFLLISRYFFNSILQLSHDFSLSKTELMGYFVDVLANISTLRFFSRQEFEKEKAYLITENTVLKDKAMRKHVIIMRVFWDISMIFAISSIFYCMVSRYSQSLATVGDFTFTISVSVSIFLNLWHLSSQYVEFSEDLGKCYQALSILEIEHGVVDADNAIEVSDVKGDIKFSKVTFRYDEENRLFENKSVHIQPQEKVGLVGYSGSGKSSFISLITRLFDVDSGSIYIDGIAIHTITQQSLRKNIAIIPQDPSLFHRTLRENIAYGKPDATDAEIIQAAKFAHCDKFIDNMEDGYNTLVGERGIKLSGGQRQRIAIARAFLENAPILILDEATSALDSVTEAYIHESLDKLMQNKTTIVIAHRLSTLAKMDRILVFDHGKIIEEGTHEELLKKDGHYAKMWAIQATGAMISG